MNPFAGIGTAILAAGAGAIGAGANALAGVGAALLRGVGSVVAGVGRGILSTVGAALRTVAQIPLRFLQGLGRVLAGSASILGSLGGVVARSLGGVAKVAVGAFAGAVYGLASGLRLAVSSTREMAHAITDLRSATGLSPGQAGALNTRIGVLGLNAGQVFGQQDPQMFQMRAAMFGLPGMNSPDFMARTAERYQQGMSGNLVDRTMARQMLQSLGLDDPATRRALMADPNRIRQDQAFAGQVQASLGIDSGEVERAGREFDSMVGKARTLGTLILNKIGVEAMPYLNQLGSGILNLLTQYEGNLGRLIERGVGLLVQGVGAGFNSFLSLGRFLAVDMPRHAFAFADSMLAGADAVLAAVPGIWTAMLRGLTAVQVLAEPAFRTIVGGIMAVANAVPNLMQTIGAGLLRSVSVVGVGVTALIRGAFTAVSGALNALGASPIFQRIMRLVESGAAGKALNAAGRYTQGADDLVKNVTNSDSAGALAGLLAIPATFSLGKMLLGGGVAGAGATGAVLSNPALWMPAVATAGAWAGYKTGQRYGLIDPEQSFLDRMQTGAGRMGAAMMGRPAAYDNYVLGQQRKLWEQAQAGKSLGNGAEAGAGIDGAGRPSRLSNPFAGLAVEMRRAAQMPSGGSLSGLGDISRQAVGLPNPLQGALAGVGATLRRGYNGPLGSLAQGLDGRFGDDLRGNVLRGRSAIGQMRSDFAAKAQEFEGRGQQFARETNQLLGEIRGLMRAGNGYASQTARNTDDTASGLSGMAERIVSRAMAYAGEDAYLAGSRVGG